MRLHFNLRLVFVAILVIGATLAIRYQQQQIQELRSQHQQVRVRLKRLELDHQTLKKDHQVLKKDHRQLKLVVRDPPIRIKPLALN